MIIVIPTLAEDGDHWNVELVGSIYYWQNIKQIAISGDYAYIATSCTGLYIVNIVDPQNPIDVGYYDLIGVIDVDPSGNSISGVAVSGNYAYVLSYRNGIIALDISDPTNPFVVESIDIDFPISIADIAIYNGFLYIADTVGIRVINISDPYNLSEVEFFEMARMLNDIVISEGYAFVSEANQGLRIIDLSDPNNLEEIGSYDTGIRVEEITIEGDYAYVSADHDGFQIIDISDLTNPVQIGLYGGYGGVRDLEINNGYLYLAAGAENLLILDVTDPTNPEEVGVYETEEGIFHITINNDKAYVDVDHTFFQIVDISDPLNPVGQGSLNKYGKANDVAIQNGYAFFDCGNAMQIIDISDVEDPEVIFTYEFDFASLDGIIVEGDYAYLSDSHHGLRIMDISDPTNPIQVGMYIREQNSWTRGLDVAGNYAYLVGSFGMKIVDVFDPTNPFAVGSYDYFFDGALNVAVSGNYVYLPSFGDGLDVVDITIPHNPIHVGSNSEFYAHNLAILEDYAYILAGEDGLKVVDISDPLNPLVVSSFDNGINYSSIKVDGAYAHLTSYSNGLRVFDISDPLDPQEIGYYDTSGGARSVVFSDNYAYVADNYSFKIFDCTDANSTTLPAPFNLLTPSNNTIIENNIAELSWSESSEDVSEYVVYYANNNQFTENLDSVTVQTTTYNLENLENTIYYWKVRANNEGSEGIWSIQTWSFIKRLSSVDDNETTLLSEYAITNTYPNPFNPTLNVNIALPETASLTVTVHNIMGQSVATVADRLYSAGIQNFSFDGSDLSSGVYFVHAIVPGKLNQIKKVVLMK
jgi:hypothetical protein